MDQSIRALSEQLKFMSMNIPTLSHPMPPSVTSRSSPSAGSSSFVPPGQSPMSQSHHRQNLPPMGPNFQQSYQQQAPPSSLHNQWYGPSLPPSHAPQPSSVQQLPQQNVVQQPPPPKTEDWDDTYLAVLGTQDLKQLRELLARSSPDVIMPNNGAGPLSQAVILTLVHRVCYSSDSCTIHRFQLLTNYCIACRGYWRDVAGR